MPTTENHIRNLQVLPSRSADLCFSMPGVIAKQNYDHSTKTGPAYLGQEVQRFDIAATLYPHLNETISDTTDPRYPGEDHARLKYDGGEIDKALTISSSGPAPFLFALRNDSIAAALDQAIVRREATYFQRFKHGLATQNAMIAGFAKILPVLTQLETDVTNRFNAVDTAHSTSGNPPVVDSTRTEVSVSSDYKVKTAQRNTISVNDEYDFPAEEDPAKAELITTVYEVTDPDSTPLTEKLVQQHKSNRMTGFPFAYDPSQSPPKWVPVKDDFLDDSISTTDGKQITTNLLPAFFHPRLDNAVTSRQLLSSIASELMNQTIASFSADRMERIVEDDKEATDLEVRRMQIAFAETYLTTPIAGVVTAVFKDVGECVQAGEPVIRVENDAVVFLTGRIQYFGVLKLGQVVVVRATDLYESGKTYDFSGKIRGIRGHSADDDEWEVFIECDNPIGTTGRRLLPIYYQFDKDTTIIVVTS